MVGHARGPLGSHRRHAHQGRLPKLDSEGDFESDGSAGSAESRASREMVEEVNQFRKLMGMSQLPAPKGAGAQQHNYSFSRRMGSSFNEASFRKIRESIKDFTATEKLRVYKACVLLQDAFDGKGHQGMFYLLKASGRCSDHPCFVETIRPATCTYTLQFNGVSSDMYPVSSMRNRSYHLGIASVTRNRAAEWNMT
jgi:hypothetical protein